VKQNGRYLTTAFSFNYVYIMSGARENLRTVWLAPLTGPEAPQARAIGEFRARQAQHMGTEPGYGVKSEILRMWKEAYDNTSLGQQFISSAALRPACTYPPLQMHFNANAAAQRGAPSPRPPPARCPPADNATRCASAPSQGA